MPDKKIKVVIHERTIANMRHHIVLAHGNIVSELKRAGIPMAGFDFWDGVTNGKLTIWREPDLNDELEYHYEWIGKEPAKVPLDKPLKVERNFDDDEDDEL